MSTPATPPETAADGTPDLRGDRWLRWGMYCVLLAACAVALSKNNADPDFWGHVQYGRDVLAEGLPDTNTYSYTAPHYRWINHENFSELFYAVAVETIGPVGLLVGKCLLGVAVIAWMLRQARRQRVDQNAALLVVLLVSLNLMHFWSLRPQLLSYLLFVVMLILFSWCFTGWEGLGRIRGWPRSWSGPPADLSLVQQRIAWLWLAVPLMALWANTHGAFLAGYCILAAYLAGRSLEMLLQHRRTAIPLVAQFAAIVFFAGLVTLLNPYGADLHRWLIRSLGVPRPEIVEWRSPELWGVVWATWWLLVVLFVAAVAGSRQPRDFTQLALLSITLWQAVEHRRHIAFFALLFGFWMPVHVASLMARMRAKQIDSTSQHVASPYTRRLMAGLLGAAALMVLFCLGTQLRQLPVRRDGYPVSAFQYIADQQLSGKLVVRFKWAQYAIAAFGTERDRQPAQLQVAFDGRFRTCYPQEVVDMYFDFAMGDAGPRWRYRSPQSPPLDPGRVLEFGQPDLVLIDRSQNHSVDVMNQNRASWVLLYQDQLAQLWGRKSKYDDPLSAHYLPPRRRYVSDDAQTGYVAWPALPLRRTPTKLAAHRPHDASSPPSSTESSIQP